MAATTTAGGTTVDAALPGVVVDGSPDLQTVTGVDGVYRLVSSAGLEPFGWTAPELLGRPLISFTHPDDCRLIEEAHGEAWRDGETITTTYRFRCADGSYRWIESRSRSIEAGGERLVVSAVRDVAERRQSELDLRRQAASDPLTGLANRTVFLDRLRHALLRLDRGDSLVAVLYLDLDRFKLINDSLGHHIGDAVLSQMAERLLQVLRPQDTLARLGGDEFAVVIEDVVDPDEAVALGARIVEAGRAPFVVGDEQFICTASAGVAVTSDAGHSAEGLLQEADLALYRAKDRGRDRADVFDEDLRTRAVGRLGTERMLRRALAEDRLRVAYQPIIELASGETVAVEALVRVWDDDAGELIAAEAFIEVAEETGVLATIDEWMLGQVVEQAAAWRVPFAGTAFVDVALNVTARDLANAGFAQSVIDQLADHHLPPGVLQVEVTERILMEASNSALTGLTFLRAAGVKVGLDDFGTGYSSLSYLRMFPLDFVKIDRSFVHGLAAGATERAIVASIIELSHALGMGVVAEGVETREQADVLAELGCDRAQGFHFAAPGPADAVADRVLGTAPAVEPTDRPIVASPRPAAQASRP
ncbi:putative bifunctional diguanylate cyclase/phosphodiesterase [Rhabdothermincola salaria]|uniref:putative bifunctional diguanylate cyclase/phosphodiesterase n=1 Tax=Rhabdothermincola salaria TaxID=2903142 RepID=UPI001E293EED|nr:EAL domain-containing protein [Rhabdothermincola salaria]MCD9625134.1 EAL domain-containing protein [Rhabdothermincola salaria]